MKNEEFPRAMGTEYRLEQLEKRQTNGCGCFMFLLIFIVYPISIFYFTSEVLPESSKVGQIRYLHGGPFEPIRELCVTDSRRGWLLIEDEDGRRESVTELEFWWRTNRSK